MQTLRPQGRPIYFNSLSAKPLAPGFSAGLLKLACTQMRAAIKRFQEPHRYPDPYYTVPARTSPSVQLDTCTPRAKSAVLCS